MQFRATPQTFLERIILLSGLAPVPLVDTLIAQLFARTIMAGTRMGIFDALERGPLSAPEVAAQCGTDPRATEKLLFALASSGYLHARGDQYRLAKVARKWLLRSSPGSLRDATLQRYLDLKLMDHAEDFVLTGRPADLHNSITPDEWELYQRGQRSHAIYAAPEVARRTPVARGARRMLDIGGSHGHYSAMLCRRHPRLQSTILDLPDAVAHAAPLLHAEGMGDRIVHWAGSALIEDLGAGVYDLVFTANLVHHFDDETNRLLQQRIARALRPGGYSVIYETIRSTTPEAAGQVGGLLDFFFAMTSEAGTWSFDEMAAWQKNAGLEPRKPIRLISAPGYGLQAAKKCT
ncbi:MAG: methyltransferase [Armatimonadota bacterium]|nr:methyltransferase [Armatimonadota bacterium]